MRTAERSGDAVAVLRWRLRSGEVSEERVELAAQLGRKAAQAICDQPGVEWDDWRARRGLLLRVSKLEGEGRRLLVAVACDYAERALPIFEKLRPNDSRPHDLLTLLRKWLADTQAVSLEEIRESRRAADAAADAAAYTAVYAAADAYAADAYAADAERGWQRARLAAYVLLEVRP